MKSFFISIFCFSSSELRREEEIGKRVGYASCPSFQCLNKNNLRMPEILFFVHSVKIKAGACRTVVNDLSKYTPIYELEHCK